jgi:flagellar basal-body rod protein FlgG
MLRGIYTGASGMLAQMDKLNVISNNIANVDTTGYKKDLTLHKAFPEMLLRRMNDNGVRRYPFGSVDFAPVVGKLGTGVETNEVYTQFTQGSMKVTENDFDLALEGEGFFSVMTPHGERYTRNGGFTLDPNGILVTKQGYQVLGENGTIRLKENNFIIDQDGKIFINPEYADDPERLVSSMENDWEDSVLLDRLKIVDFKRTRELEKQGDSLWNVTEFSGDAFIAEGNNRPKIHQGFLEGSNVNPVVEMVRMIEVNRNYEANQKMIQTQDMLAGRLINETLKV